LLTVEAKSQLVCCRQMLAPLVVEQQRLPTTLATSRPRIEVHTAWLRQERDEMDREFAPPDPREFGPMLATTLIAELPELGHLNRKQIAAL